VPPPRAQHVKCFTLIGSSFFRSYGGNLPSSLTIVLPIALVFSTRPPVSVWGTGTVPTHCWAFLGSMGSVTSPETARHHVSAFEWANSHRPRLHAYPGTTIAPVHLPSCVLLQLASTSSAGSPEGSPHVADIGLGADTVVLEYQPVVHRLRLAASP
jgi:hypothetical protein